jgi:TRAP-type C4-dicarboxylate transport system permease small subunit
MNDSVKPLLQLENRLRQLFVGLAVVATLAGVIIVMLVGASVVMRHIAQTPFRFTEELVGLLMTTAFFLALPLVTLNAEHVRVQILVNSLPKRMAQLVSIAAGLFGVVFTVWFCWLCLPWFEFAYERNIKTEVGRLVMYPWMSVLPLSMLLTSIAFAIRTASGFKPLSSVQQNP